MTPEQIVAALQAMNPEQLQKTMELATRAFTQKAEALYDQDPENNGLVAQPYAELATMFESGAMIWDEPEDALPIDDEELTVDTAPSPVSQATGLSLGAGGLSLRPAPKVTNPWGGR